MKLLIVLVVLVVLSIVSVSSNPLSLNPLSSEHLSRVKRGVRRHERYIACPKSLRDKYYCIEHNCNGCKYNAFYSRALKEQYDYCYDHEECKSKICNEIKMQCLNKDTNRLVCSNDADCAYGYYCEWGTQLCFKVPQRVWFGNWH